MKRKLLILTFVFLSFSAWANHSSVQHQLKTEKHQKSKAINLTLAKVSVEEIFEQIEQQAGYAFIYMTDAGFLKKKISVDFKDKSLQEVLSDLSAKLNAEFKVTNNGILVKVIREVSPEQEEKKISGVILDEHNTPIPGANIYVKGTNQGVISNTEGKFSLDVPGDATAILISFIGYEKQEIEIGSQTTFQITLKELISEMEEIVVTGYGTESRKNVTASISTLDPKEIYSVPKSNVIEMLEGRLAGIQVLSDNSPGGGTALRVRGYSTVNYNDPLVVVDGVPISGGLNSINPSDIESINILKDAASASIYGSRAANGVVVITTKKKSSTDGFKFRFEPYFGIQSAYNLPNLLNAQQYGDLLWQAYQNDGQTPSHDIYGDNPEQAVIPEWLDDDQTIPSDDVNWMDEIIRKAKVQSYNLSLFKGDSNGYQSFTLGYFKQEGLIKYTYFDRYSARMNSTYNIGKHLKVGEFLTGSYSEKVSAGTNSALGSIIFNAMQFPSIVPVKDINGAYAGNPINDLGNPLGQLNRAKDNKGKTVNAIGNVFASLHFGDLVFKSSFGIDYQNYNARSFSPEYDEILSTNSTNSLSATASFNYQWTWTNTLSYKKYFKGHHFDFILGQEAIQYYYEYMSASRDNFLYEDLSMRYLSYGTENQLNSGGASSWSLASYFGKANYNYDQKYLLSFTLRYDGSSRLANNKWGTFPAASAGWRLDRENFLNFGNTFSSFLLRGSYGQTGNQEIDSYATVNSYSSASAYSNYDISGSQNTVYTGLTQTRIANPDLKWETTTQTSIGVDLGFFNDRLKLTAEYYNKLTKDFLVYATTPSTYGGTNDGQWVNDGNMRNRGYEIALNYKDKLGKLSYAIGANISGYKNKMIELNSADYLGIPSSSLHSVNFDQEISRSAVGQPIGSFYGYLTDGIFQTEEEIEAYGLQPDAQPGDLKFVDTDKNGSLDDNDRTFIGSPHPDFTLGLNINLQYQRFDLSLFFNGVFGNELYNLTKYKTHFFNQSAYNKSSDLLNAWSEDNTGSDIPRLSLDDPNNNIRPSSYYVENGTYFKLNNLQLGYTVNPEIIRNKYLRFYAQVTNVFTLTKYSGLTPQIGLQSYTNRNRNLDIGIDRGIYPPSRTFTIGCNLNF